MTNPPKLLNKFRISEYNLKADTAISEAYDAYSERRFEFGEARKRLNETTKALHDLLDEPLRDAGLVQEGCDWTFTEPDGDLGLVVRVWSELKAPGRTKSEVPFQEVAFQNKVA